MEYEINLNADEIISLCSKREKKELLKALLEDESILGEKERIEKKHEEELAEKFMLMQALEAMTPFELKKTLCNLLGVGTYTDEQGLREKLEKIIKA
jgi:hypothetical protein